MLSLEQVLSAQKSQFGVAFGAGAKVFEGVEQLARLNLQTARASLDECAEACRAVLAVTEPQQLAALQSALAEPAAARWAGYAGQVYAILSATGAQLRQLAEQSASEAQGSLVAAVETALAEAPAGSEGAAAVVRQALEAANTALRNAQEAWRQAGEAADAQVETMTTTLGTAARAQKVA